MTIKKAQRLGVKDEVVGAGCHDSIPRFAVCILNHWTSFQCAMHTRPGTPKIQPITKHHSKKKNPSAHPMCCAYKATPNSLVLAIIVSISSLSRLICCAMLPALSNHDAERVHAFVQQNMHYYPIFNRWMDATQKRITGRLFFWQAEDHYAWRDLMSAMMQSGIVTAVHEASSPSISSNPPSVHTSNVQPGPLPSPLVATSCTASTPNVQFEGPIPTPGSLSFTMPLSSSAVASPGVHRMAVNYTPTPLLSEAQPYFPPYLPMPPQNVPNQPWFDPSSHQSFARIPPPGSGQLELNPHMNPTFGQPASSASRALGSANVIAQPISPDTHGAEARKKRQREPHLDLNAGASDDGHAEKRARCTQSKEEIDKQRRERYQEVRDEVNKQRRERYKQLYAQKKDSINARRRERYQEANKDNINEQRRQRYQEADTDNINEHRRQRYHEADKDNIHEERRQRYQEADKDNINEQRRERYPEAKDNINEQRRERYPEAKDNINEQRRERYPEA